MWGWLNHCSSSDLRVSSLLYRRRHFNLLEQRMLRCPRSTPFFRSQDSVFLLKRNVSFESRRQSSSWNLVLSRHVGLGEENLQGRQERPQCWIVGEVRSLLGEGGSVRPASTSSCKSENVWAFMGVLRVHVLPSHLEQTDQKSSLKICHWSSFNYWSSLFKLQVDDSKIVSPR